MISVSDEIKLRAEIAARMLETGNCSRAGKAIEIANDIVDDAIKTSLKL